ncbi:hypothetical protein Pve01_89970 [Planomonospora venezuelensis]|nr:hypothetical protein Pve01_89970 [Planomonospora venezuelensis]
MSNKPERSDPAFARVDDLTVEPFLEAARTRNAVPMADQARLAALYVARVAEGDRSPAQWLARRYDGTSEKTWRNRIHRLRALGLLSDAPRGGVAGGTLTALAFELLGLAAASPEVRANYEGDRKWVDLTDREWDEIARLPGAQVGSADLAMKRWLEANPDVGRELFEDWWLRVSEKPPTNGGNVSDAE